MADEKKITTKLKVLLEAQRKCLSQLQAVTDEIDALLGGGVGIGERLKALEGHWSELWRIRYKTPYQFNYVQDRAQLKRFLRTMTDEEIAARMTRCVRSDDPFLSKNRHPFSLFVRSINEWARPAEPGSSEDDFPLVHDCQHRPACRDDAEHTKKKLAEMRTSA